MIIGLILPCQMNFQSVASASIPPTILVTPCSENVTIYFLDVGQGDSILIKTSNRNILIDGGSSGAGSTLLNYLKTYQVSKIDLLFATHPHEDHIGGLVPVLQSSIPIQDIVYNGYNYTTQIFNTWKTLASTHNLTIAYRNQVYALTSTINFTVINPTNPLQFSDLNSNSIVLRLQVSNTSIMLTGDATTDTEQSMLASGLTLQSQILKVGHHGSSYSTSQAFLNNVTPNYGVISAGVGNSYGHPTQQTLDRLSNNDVITYGTYKDGTIVFRLESASQTPTVVPSPTSTPAPTLIQPNPTDSSPKPGTVTPAPIIIPTQTPTINSNPTNSKVPSQTVDPSPTSTIPELSTLLILMLIGLTSLSAVKLRNRSKEISRHIND
jgi:competence protein ComEC